MVLLKLSDHWKVSPTWGNSPSKLLPILNPPEILMNGTPSRLAPHPGGIPIPGLVGSAKQLVVGTLFQEFFTSAVCLGCKKVPFPSRNIVNRASVTAVSPNVPVC